MVGFVLLFQYSRPSSIISVTEQGGVRPHQQNRNLLAVLAVFLSCNWYLAVFLNCISQLYLSGVFSNQENHNLQPSYFIESYCATLFHLGVLNGLFLEYIACTTLTTAHQKSLGNIPQGHP